MTAVGAAGDERRRSGRRRQAAAAEHRRDDHSGDGDRGHPNEPRRKPTPRDRHVRTELGVRLWTNRVDHSLVVAAVELLAEPEEVQIAVGQMRMRGCQLRKTREHSAASFVCLIEYALSADLGSDLFSNEQSVDDPSAAQGCQHKRARSGRPSKQSCVRRGE